MHQGLSRHIIPVVNALPASGLKDQMIQWNGVVYIWHQEYGEWNPLIGHTTIMLETDRVITNNGGDNNLCPFPVKANAVYEIEWKFLAKWEGASGQYATHLILPAGSICQGLIESHHAETGADFIYTAQLTANKSILSSSTGADRPMMQINGSGLIKTGPTAGNFIFQWAKLGVSLMTLFKGSYLIYRRVG